MLERTASKHGNTLREAGDQMTNVNNMGSFAGGQVVSGPSLKVKLLSVEDLIKKTQEDLNYHKKEIMVLLSEKDTLSKVLQMKTSDVKKTLTNELSRLEDEMERHFGHQKSENTRLTQQITTLKAEKTALQQQLLGLQRRITELETQVGNMEFT